MDGSQCIKLKKALTQGAVIAYPTEAVWGLGCDPFNEKAVNEILRLKQRPIEKGLILVAGQVKHVEFLFENLTEQERETLLKYWPGPYTFLLPDPNNLVPKWVKGQYESVAVRVSEHDTIRKVSDCFGSAVVSTSANPAGMIPAMDSGEVSRYFDGEVITIIDGELGQLEQPTKIIDLRSGVILRS